MWCPIRVEINNLFAAERLEYEFNNNVCTVVTGKNYTDKNFENNGAGKSTIFEAIALAITGDCLRPIKKDSFINKSKSVSSCSVALELYNDVLKKKVRIEREFFKSSKSSTCLVYENGLQNKQLVSVAEANKRILELIGICKDDLVRYFIVGQDNRYNFFTASDSDKKEILNRITNADMINSVLQRLSDSVKAKQADLEAEKINEGKLLGKMEMIDVQIKDLLENDDTEWEVKKLEREIVGWDAELVSRGEKKDKLENELMKMEQHLAKMKLVDLSKTRDKINKLNKSMDYSDGKLLEVNKLKKKLELILDGVLKCPKCGEKFVADNELKLIYEEALEIKLEVDSKAKELAEEVNVLSIKISEAYKELKAAKEQNLKYEACEHDINKQNKLIEVEEYEIEALNVKIAKKKVEVEDLKSGKQRKERIEELKQRKRGVLKKYNECREVLKVADDELNMLKFWQFNMGKSGFQTYLANKSIKRLEGTINNYLDKMKIDYRVQIEPYKVLKSGDVREKIDCFVSCNGYDWQNFMTFSGGERQRIILAGILAIQKLINDSLGANGLNMLIMDETLWQMDNVGTVSAIRILERIGITILITTQNIEEPEKIFENYLKVVKIDGVSKFQS